MKAYWLVCGALTLWSCDTFRSLDSVPIPDVADATSTVPDASPLPDAGPRDGGETAQDMEDTGEPSDAEGSETGIADAARDGGVDGGQDAGMGGCPSTSPSEPPWASATEIITDTVIIHDADDAYETISIAASAFDASVSRFAVGYRLGHAASVPVTRVGAVSASGDFESTVIGHIIAEPFLDIAVARATTPDQFAFLAIAENPACDTEGIQAMSGLVGDSNLSFGLLTIATISGPCGLLTPRAALTGADGTSPNYRLARSSNFTGDVLAYPWADESMPVTQSGNPLVSHISASTHDLVATPGPTFDEWLVWRPAVASQPLTVDLDGDGDLEVEHLREGCYVGATPTATGVAYLPIECDGECVAGSAFAEDIVGTVRRADIAAMPGGGFVIATATGDAFQTITLRFFGDDFQPLTVGTQVSVEAAPARGQIGDFAVAATRDGDDIIIATAYTVIGFETRDVEVSLVRLGLP